MKDEAALACETIWFGCAAYSASSDVEVGDRWYLTGIAHPEFNGAFPSGNRVEVDAILRPFRVRRVPMLWHLAPASPDRVEPRLVEVGCQFDEEEPLMVAHVSAEIAVPPVAGLEIVRAIDASRLATIVKIWTGSEDASWVARLVRLRSATDAFEHLLGILDGVPVACTAAFHGPGASEVQHVVTVAGMRRRGIGAAMTAAAMQRIRGRGAEVAVLTSSPSRRADL